jgi:hypothetical protein
MSIDVLPPPDPATFVHDRFVAAGTPIGPVTISGAATVQEVAAVVAALEHLWPKPVLLAHDRTRETPSWRFSGRWWSRPNVTRRERPWVR